MARHGRSFPIKPHANTNYIQYFAPPVVPYQFQRIYIAGNNKNSLFFRTRIQPLIRKQNIFLAARLFKTWNGVTFSSIKTMNGITKTSIKTRNGL